MTRWKHRQLSPWPGPQVHVCTGFYTQYISVSTLIILKLRRDFRNWKVFIWLSSTLLRCIMVIVELITYIWKKGKESRTTDQFYAMHGRCFYCALFYYVRYIRKYQFKLELTNLEWLYWLHWKVMRLTVQTTDNGLFGHSNWSCLWNMLSGGHGNNEKNCYEKYTSIVKIFELEFLKILLLKIIFLLIFSKRWHIRILFE